LIHVMHKRFHAQRQHIIHSLDTLLYQLHTLSFFLSPSIWIYIVRILSQFQYSKPRELDPSRSLRFFYSMVFLFNLPSLWKHSTRGELGGRAIILDFIGMSYTPSRPQLFLLDIFIIILQLLLTTIAYEASVYYASEEVDPKDTLLPEISRPLSIPLFQSHLGTPMEPKSQTSFSMQSPQPKTCNSEFYNSPLVIDLRFNSIIAHLRHPPHPHSRPANPDPILPVPNAPWPLPGMAMWLHAGRQIRDTAPGRGIAGTGGARILRGTGGSLG